MLFVKKKNNLITSNIGIFFFLKTTVTENESYKNIRRYESDPIAFLFNRHVFILTINITRIRNKTFHVICKK